MIGITQPRRMAAISLAKRVAQELGAADPGDDDAAAAGAPSNGVVGFAIRFQDRTTPRTRIKFMTDGWLLREFVAGATSLVQAGLELDDIEDPNHPSLLPQYSVLIVDEAHERSVRTDLLLGLAKRVQKRRGELRQKWERQQRSRSNPGQVDMDDPKAPQRLHLVIMSATLDAALFSEFFAQPAEAENKDSVSSDGTNGVMTSAPPTGPLVPAPVVYIKGRTHPVTLCHLLDPATDWLDAAKRQILQLHVSKPLGGDILVFGTGAEEIEALAGSLRQMAEHLPQWAKERPTQTTVGKLLIVPLYAALGSKAVAQVFKPTPPNTRKIVVATNIAETSVTIPGVRFVVDCGLAKEKMHISHSDVAGPPTTVQFGGSSKVGIETLTTRPISKSAAAQRAGRAGREAPGECYRLYPMAEFDAMEATTVPEIHRTELSAVALDCYSAGVDPTEVEWVDRPDQAKLQAAVMELAVMGAIAPVKRHRMQDQASSKEGKENSNSHDEEGDRIRLQLTDLGRSMAKLPLPPRFSHLLITAAQTQKPVLMKQARDLVAILSSERSIFTEPSMASLLSGHQKNGKGQGENTADAVERLEAKRAEAEKAKMVFRHRSGDHVTMLRAFRAFLAQARKGDAAHQDNSQRSTAADDLKVWCNKHFLSLRSLREVEDVREQLTGICRRAGMAGFSGDDGVENAQLTAGGNGARGKSAKRLRLDRGIDGDRDSSDGDDDNDDSGDEPLTVHRHTNGSHATADQTTDIDDENDPDYVDLRKLLVSSRSSSNIAIRIDLNARGADGPATATSGSYRVLCGSETFKLHPTSSLHARNADRQRGRSGAGGAPQAILFEELSYTTQMYVRVASEVELSWINEGVGAPKA